MSIDQLLGRLASPARRALEQLKLGRIEDFSRFTEEEIGALHGIGPAALKLIKEEMTAAKVQFKGEGRSSRQPATPADPIDRYIRSFPENVQRTLNRLREIIRSAAPEATERISYRMPAFYLNGNLVYFAAFKNHVGLYPLPHTLAAFEAELTKYKKGKGSIQFPLDESLPEDLIYRIVKQRVQDNLNKSATGGRRRGS